MSAKTSILEKLKAKPIAKKKDDLTFELIITDNSKDNALDRNLFLSRISTAFKTRKKKPVGEIDRLAPMLEISDEPPASTPLQQDASKPASKNASKKTKKRVRITDEVIGIEIDEQGAPEAPDSASISGKRITPQPSKTVIAEGPMTMIQIGDTETVKRLPKKRNEIIRASAYYLNNREIFINFINTLFSKYKTELGDLTQQISCSDKRSEEFRIMTHQKIVRDYLSIYTPYRGLLLYHGLGSGKTCSSIAIAEGLKTDKQVIVMTPASLRRNYIEELKKCGDHIYKKNQFWEFVQVGKNEQLISELSRMLQLSEDYIRRRGGAWLVNVVKPSNFEGLDTEYKNNIDSQINEMIRNKYQFINYNGMKYKIILRLTKFVLNCSQF